VHLLLRQLHLQHLQQQRAPQRSSWAQWPTLALSCAICFTEKIEQRKVLPTKERTEGNPRCKNPWHPIVVRANILQIHTATLHTALENSEHLLADTSMELEEAHTHLGDSQLELEESQSALEEAHVQLLQVEAEVLVLREELQITLNFSMQTLQDVSAKCDHLEQLALQEKINLGLVHLALQDTQTEIKVVRARKAVLDSKQDAMLKRIWWQPGVRECAVDKAVGAVVAARAQVTMKKKGVMKNKVRDLFRQLAGIGVATQRVDLVVHNITAAFGLTVTNNISTCSVSRLVLEGLIQAKIQIAFEIEVTTSK
jgi:hypothetical protein